MAGMRQFRAASPAKHRATASVPLREELYGRLLGKSIETIFGLAVIQSTEYIIKFRKIGPNHRSV